MKSRIQVFVALLLLVHLCAGCAVGFRGGNLPPISSWPPETQPSKRSVALNVTVTDIIRKSNKVDTVPPRRLASLTEISQRAYRDSGLISEIKSEFAETDLRVDMKITSLGEGSAPLVAFLSGLTLYLVPWYYTSDYVISATFSDRSGKSLGSFEKAESFTQWTQLFLSVLAPFKSGEDVHLEIIYDLNRAIIIEAHQKGVI